MPTAPRPLWNLAPGCAAFAAARGRCALHAAAYERTRPNADVRQWYHLARWRRLRRDVLADDPLCVRCAVVGRATRATDVDHRQPHGGDPLLFWARENLQPLCASCHSVKTSTEDRGR
jgi:5-methylcytosine-specific restriction protein A